MVYQALYRKYRPHSFDDFIDQENVKKILINSLMNDKVSHAYLFSGPRGIGKTSLAKIFAKAINCLDFKKKSDVCDKCTNCLECNDRAVDIIEIDAASNNGVDQIRDLRNKINIVPSVLNYKIYIIDEVHMLTNSAFNALLKTLEEPPSHVIFILATTEFYEVPETIVSRCQCFNFSRISIDGMKKRLNSIIKKEKILIDSEVVSEISQYANGGLRDAIGMLDKLNSFANEKITIDDFKSINGLISFEDIEQFYSYVFELNYKEVMNLIAKIENSGYDFKNFVERLMLYTRDIVINYYINNSESKYNLNDNIVFISKLNEILVILKDTVTPLVVVQVYILKYMNDLKSKKCSEIISQEIKSGSKIDNKIISQEINMTKENNITKEKEINKSICINEKIKSIRINNTLATADKNLKSKIQKNWKNLNDLFLDEKYGKVSQLLADASPMVVGKENIILTCSTDGLIEKIYENIILIEELLSKFNDTLIKIVVLKNEEFEIIKNKYIEDIKNKVVYETKVENESFVEYNNGNLISKAIKVFGSDLIEIEEEK